MSAIIISTLNNSAKNMVKSSIVKKNLSSFSRPSAHVSKKYDNLFNDANPSSVSSNSGGRIHSGSKHYVNNSATAQTAVEDDANFTPIVSSQGSYVSTSGHSKA